MTNSLTPTQLNNFTSHIKENVLDETIQLLLIDYFHNGFQLDLNKKHFRMFVTGSRYVIQHLLYNYLITSISWNNYCIGMNSLLSEKGNSIGIDTILGARIFLCDFYRFVIHKHEMITIDIYELSIYKHLLIDTEKREAIPYSTCMTNFPINSEPRNLYLFEQENSDYKMIINLNAYSPFIKQLLIQYINNNQFKSPASNDFRLFVFYFEKSLWTIGIPNQLIDFNYNVYKHQYRFYRRLKEVTEIEFPFEIYLNQFYFFLYERCENEKIVYNIINHCSKIDLLNPHFNRYYSEGFEYVVYSRLNDMPISNRWVVKSKEDNKSAIHSDINRTFDFTKIKNDTYREYAKRYVWHQTNQSFLTIAHDFNYLVEFLNFKYSYDTRNKSVVYIGEEKVEFPNQFILEFKSYIHSKHKKQETRRAVLKSLKGFLSFHRDKYKINELTLLSLNVATESNDDGGNPIDADDLKIILNEFQNRRSLSIRDELYYIIFNLSVTTKLRYGAVSNLERDCIISKNSTTGTVSYYSKAHKNQKVTETLSIDKIRLIERAIKITEDIHNAASQDISKFIFIADSEKNVTVPIQIGRGFASRFSKIIKLLQPNLKSSYTPYNLRDTYIDAVYTEGIKEGINTLTLSNMTGNSPTVALKHYRKKSEIIRYAEVFSGVVISNVDIKGNIVNDTIIEKYNPVKNNTGACTQSTCVTTDNKYECLICNYFATTTSRINNFKQNIRETKEKLKSCRNELERKKIEVELKLYSAYYAKLLELKGDNNGSS